MQNKLFIPIILGTNRQGRNTEHAARWIFDKLGKREGIETVLFDVRDFHLPDDDYGQVLKEQFSEYRDAIIRADGLIIVSPEYNHGYPGRLKSVLDLVLREYVHKAVALVGVSAGPWGGTRVIEQLALVVRELGAHVTFKDLNFPKVGDIFAEDGSMKDEYAGPYEERVSAFFEELIWMARTLKWGRENVPTEFRK